nr:hypothetical protein [Tanacetum cinerariifolium]
EKVMMWHHFSPRLEPWHETTPSALSELGLNLSLLLPEQDLPLPRRKRKAIELEPETYIDGLHCNRKLLEGVQFVKNLVIRKREQGQFFIDAFEEQAIQRVSDIQKVETEPLLGYKMIVSKR